MEDLYSIHPGISRAGGGGAVAAASEASGVAGGAGSPPPPPPPADLTELVKAQIAGHPRYPSLLSAYIECRKVPRRRIMSLELACRELRKDCVDFMRLLACPVLDRFGVAGGRAAGGGHAAGGDRPGAVRRRGGRRGGRPGPRARRVHGTPSAHHSRAHHALRLF